MNRRTWLALCATGLSASLGLAGEVVRRTYSRRYCHLPCYDYRTSFSTNPRSEVSTVCIPLPAAGDAVAPLQVKSETPPAVGTMQQTKTFQLARTHLQNDHCRLGQITMTIVEDGTWILHFQASQDPSLVGEQRRPAFERYARNFLHVAVRGVGLLPVPDVQDNAPLGKPEYCKLSLLPIRLEKRETRNLRLGDQSAEIKRYFSRIDQIEVDLCYE